MKMRINIPPSDFCWFILNFMISNLFLLFGIFHFELWFPNFRLSCFAENLHQSTAMGTYLKIWLRIYFHISVGFSFYLRIYVQPNSHIFYSNNIYIFCIGSMRPVDFVHFAVDIIAVVSATLLWFWQFFRVKLSKFQQLNMAAQQKNKIFSNFHGAGQFNLFLS